MKKKKFRGRAFISFTLFFTFCIISVSGIVLYLRPEGSIAKWVGWSLLGLDKKGWEALHTLFNFIFIPVVLTHLYFNWRVLTNYLKTRYNEGLKLKKEFLVSLSLVLILFVGITQRLNPFWLISEWRSDIKKGSYWLKVPPPEPDFHNKTLSEIAVSLNISVEALMHIVEQLNLKIDSPMQDLKGVSQKNNMTPENIYMKLKSAVARQSN